MDQSRKKILSYATYLNRAFLPISYLRTPGQGKYFSNWPSEVHWTNSAHIFGVQELLILYPENSKEMDNTGKIINKMVV